MCTGQPHIDTLHWNSFPSLFQVVTDQKLRLLCSPLPLLLPPSFPSSLLYAHSTNLWALSFLLPVSCLLLYCFVVLIFSSTTHVGFWYTSLLSYSSSFLRNIVLSQSVGSTFRFLQFKNNFKEASELAKWLISVHALTEDPGSVPHIHMGAQNHL